MSDWRYYNNALISNLAPQMTPDVSELKKKETWKIGGGSCSIRTLDE